MALLWMDGFDHYKVSAASLTAAELLGAYTDANSVITSVTAVLGRSLSAQGGTTSLLGPIRSIGSAVTTLGVGFHFQYETGAVLTHGIVSFMDASGNQVGTLTINTTGVLALTLTTPTGTAVATATETIPANTWVHIETKIVKSATVGTFEVRVNGRSFVSFSGNTGTDPMDRVRLITKGGGGSLYFYYDNLFIWDASGTENNDWFGERNVYTLMPTADTVLADWAPSTGSDGYAMIDNVPPLPDTQYIQGNTVDDESAFTLADTPSTDILVKGVQILVKAQKSGTSDNQIEFGVDDGTNKVASPDTSLSQGSSIYFNVISEINPTTSLPWEAGEIDDLLVYVKRVV